MRRIITTIALIVALIVAFTAGFQYGEKHTILNANISEDNECYLLEINGNIYEYSREEVNNVQD